MTRLIPNTISAEDSETPQRRTAVSPAENHLMTWKRSSTWRAWPRWASMADL